MEPSSLLSVTPIYIAILGLLFIPFTMRVALYRVKTKISLGDGDDPEMVRRMRGQANFVETVPIALVLLLAMELLGASNEWLHALGFALVLSRTVHYLGVTEVAPMAIQLRFVGILATLLTIVISSLWLVIDVL